MTTPHIKYLSSCALQENVDKSGIFLDVNIPCIAQERRELEAQRQVAELERLRLDTAGARGNGKAASAAAVAPAGEGVAVRRGVSGEASGGMEDEEEEYED